MDALLIIDVQQALIAGAYQEQEVLAAINTAVKHIRSRNGLVVYIQHCHSNFEPMKKGSAGWQLHKALDVRDEDIKVEKTASDAFYETNLDELLRSRNVEHLYVAGLQTEFCIDASCRSALSKDYRVTLVSDGHTTAVAQLQAQQIIDHHNYALANLAHPKHQIRLLASAEV